MCRQSDQRPINESGSKIYYPPLFTSFAFVAQRRVETNVYRLDQRTLSVELYKMMNWPSGVY